MKKAVYYFWGTMILASISAYLIHPNLYHVSTMQRWIEWCSLNIWLAYILLTLVRGLFLLPSTPFVLGGAFLLPQAPVFVLLVSMVGVLLSASLVYYHSGQLAFTNKLAGRYPNRVEQLRKALGKPRSTILITLWSIFPLVPTDLICYVAALAKMPVQYMLGGVFLGELLLNYCLIYLSGLLY